MKLEMNNETSASSGPRATLVPLQEYCLAQLSDADLLTNTRCLVGTSNQLFAALLAHLAEVEARGVHRTRACSSLYTYCVYELRMSEDAAFRRATAAKLVKRFSALFEAISSGELHLTGLLMLGPHLTEANIFQVLARAKHRTKKEIGELVRILSPLPDVPPRIAPLGPAPARDARASANPGWDDFVQSMVPVRELTPGDRPRDWTSGTSAVEGPETNFSVPQPLRPAPAKQVRASEQVRASGGSKPPSSAVVTSRQPHAARFSSAIAGAAAMSMRSARRAARRTAWSFTI